MVCWWVLIDRRPLAISELGFKGEKKRENIGIEKSVLCWVYVKFRPKKRK
jgi:hypothetical protein